MLRSPPSPAATSSTRNVTRYADNRALLHDDFRKLAFARFAPADGAFYLYADVTSDR